MRETAIVIGGGLGGLFTAAILSREGFRVTVLEKNATIGGGLQTFTRWGETFDTGMHILGALRPGGNVWRICQYLGIAERVRARDVDSDCADSLFFAEDAMTYRVAEGRDGFVSSLASYFPDEREGLERYVADLFRMTASVDLFNLRPTEGLGAMPLLGDDFLVPADEFIARYTSDARLRSVLAYMNPLYGGRAGQTPAYVHAIISTLYINGVSRFVGGSSHFAELLASVVRECGGRCLPARP